MQNNSLKISIVSILAAVGIVLRTAYVPIFQNVQLTPGMIAPILSGMLLGWLGIVTGIIVGVYAGLFSGEFWVIPFVGNICLALGSAIITELFIKENHKFFTLILYLVFSGTIGGFLPTFVLTFSLLATPLIIAAGLGVIDLINALIAAFVSIPLWSIITSKFHILQKEQQA